MTAAPVPALRSDPAAESERLLAGAVLIAPEEVLPLVAARDFADPRARAIVGALQDLVAAGDPLPAWPAVAARTECVGADMFYLLDVTEEAGLLAGVARAESLAGTVREGAQRRRLVAAARRVQIAAEDGATADELAAVLASATEETDAGHVDDLAAWSDVAAEPPVAWLVDGVVPAGGLVVLAGDPGAGKTLLALDVALRAAHGLDWHGRAVRPFSTLYVAGEGGGGLGARLRAWKAAHDGARMVGHYVAVSRRMPDLGSPAGVADLRRKVDRLKRQHGHAPGLLVLDTLARALGAADENDAAAVGAVLAGLAALERDFGCATLILHHARKPAVGQRGRTQHDLRGSSAVAGAADAVLLASTTGDARALSLAKVRDGEEWAPIAYEVRSQQTGRALDDGRHELGPVVLPAAATEPASAEADEERQRAALAEAADKRRRAVVATVATMGGSAPSARSIVERTVGKDGPLFAAIKEAVAVGELRAAGSGFELVAASLDSLCAPPDPLAARAAGSSPARALPGRSTGSTGQHRAAGSGGGDR